MVKHFVRNTISTKRGNFFGGDCRCEFLDSDWYIERGVVWAGVIQFRMFGFKLGFVCLECLCVIGGTVSGSKGISQQVSFLLARNSCAFEYRGDAAGSLNAFDLLPDFACRGAMVDL
jgi:hypothetical protein